MVCPKIMRTVGAVGGLAAILGSLVFSALLAEPLFAGNGNGGNNGKGGNDGSRQNGNDNGKGNDKDDKKGGGGGKGDDRGGGGKDEEHGGGGGKGDEEGAGGDEDQEGVPEIDPGAMGSALALLAGGLLCLTDPKRRQSA